MFNFFKKRKLQSIPNTRSIAFGLPQVMEVRRALNLQDYEGIKNCYTALQNGERSLLVEGIAMEENTIPAVLEWHRAQPNDWLSNLFAGAAYTSIAWKERTGQLAKHLVDSQVMGFFNNLEEAKRCLFLSRSLKADEPETYARLIRVHMGFSEKSDAQSCFDTILTLDKEHLFGHMFMVNLLAAKWLGSFEEQQSFAFRFKYPETSDVRYIIFLMFTIEHFVSMSDENASLAEAVYKNEYRELILRAYKKMDIPSIPSLQRYYLHNYFSFVFHLMDNRKMRNHEIDLIGNNIPLFPWIYGEVMGERDLQLAKFS